MDFVIRPEEVMVIREGEPVKESLKGNIFEGEIRKIIERETHHAVLLREVGKGVIFQANIPTYVFRNVQGKGWAHKNCTGGGEENTQRYHHLR